MELYYVLIVVVAFVAVFAGRAIAKKLFRSGEDVKRSAEAGNEEIH